MGLTCLRFTKSMISVGLTGRGLASAVLQRASRFPIPQVIQSTRVHDSRSWDMTRLVKTLFLRSTWKIAMK
jgi:hypothetical protein